MLIQNINVIRPALSVPRECPKCGEPIRDSQSVYIDGTTWYHNPCRLPEKEYSVRHELMEGMGYANHTNE